MGVGVFSLKLEAGGNLDLCERAGVCELAGTDGAKFCGSYFQHLGTLPIESNKLDLVSCAIAVDMDDRSDVTYLKPIAGKGGGEHYPLVFFHHCRSVGLSSRS